MKNNITKLVLFISLITTLSLALNSCSSDKKPESAKKLTSKQVAKQVGKDIVFLENDFASGSGILLNNGYVLTNEHVIDGLNKIDVTFENGKKEKDVKVAASFVKYDLALVGPLKQKSDIKFGSTKKITKGDEIYLLGYPEEVEKKPETTITKGIISRIRKTEDKKVSFLQTDAALTFGQSGGAMVNTKGELLGVTGMGDGTFGFALDIENVKEAIKSMEKHKIIPSLDWPTKPNDKRGKTTNVVNLVNRYDSSEYIFYSEKKTKLILEFPKDQIPSLDVSDLFGDMEYFSNSQSLALQAQINELVKKSPNFPQDEFEDFEAEEGEGGDYEDPVLVPVSPGKYEVNIPKDTYVQVLIQTPDFNLNNFSTTITSSAGLIYHDNSRRFNKIELNKKVEGEIDTVNSQNQYEIELQKDKTYIVSLRSILGYPSFFVAPSAGLKGELYFNDFDEEPENMFDTTSKVEITPKETQNYTVFVPTDGYSPMNYELTVKEKKVKDKKDKSTKSTTTTT